MSCLYDKYQRLRKNIEKSKFDNTHIYILTSWIKPLSYKVDQVDQTHSNYKNTINGFNIMKSIGYIFSFKVVLIDLEIDITLEKIYLVLKVIHTSKNNHTIIKKNDILKISVDQNELFWFDIFGNNFNLDDHNFINCFIENLFSYYYDFGQLTNYNSIQYEKDTNKSYIINLYSKKLDQISSQNFLHIIIDDQTDSSYYDVEDIEQKIQKRIDKKHAGITHLEHIKNMILEKKDIYHIISELEELVKSINTI